MSHEDFDRWEARYANPTGDGGAPDPFFVTVAAAWLPRRGTAVDLAGGRGRHARWLAASGLQTTLVDISPTGLALAQSQAAEAGLSLDIREHDFDLGLPAGVWDVGVLSYFLLREQFGALSTIIRPGGLFLMVHPTTRNLERHPRPGRRWLLEEGTFTGLPGFEVVHLEEGWDARGRHETRYIGRRSAP
ncbi:MAG: class I SAM-dependent methyltransferase [Myxococcota bacterium]